MGKAWPDEMSYNKSKGLRVDINRQGQCERALKGNTQAIWEGSRGVGSDGKPDFKLTFTYFHN